MVVLKFVQCRDDVEISRAAMFMKIPHDNFPW